MTKEEILKSIDQFLEETFEGDYSWKSVNEEDLEKLYKIVDELIRRKWKPDCDNDSPVEIRLLDLSRYQKIFWQDIPHSHKKISEEEKKERFRRVIDNLDIANSLLKETLENERF